MKHFKIIIITFLLLFLIACNEEKPTPGKDIQEIITLTSDDIIISNITHDSFSYSIKSEDINIIDVKLINDESEIDVSEEDSVFTNLNYDTNYILRIKYSYMINDDLVQKEVETNITTASIPLFVLEIEDNFVIFRFDDINDLKKIEIDGREYQIESSELIIKDLEFEKTYNYNISYYYLDSVLSYAGSFTTLNQKEMTISFVNPKKSNHAVGTATYKTGEDIEIPTAINPIFSLNGKTYILEGFDKDINMIRSDETVNAVYKELAKKSTYSFKELYPLIANASREDVTKIEIWKSFTDAYDPTPIKYAINSDDIGNVLDKTKLSIFTIDEKYQEKYGRVSYMIYFYINNCRYYFWYFDDAVEIYGNHYVISQTYLDLIANLCK